MLSQFTFVLRMKLQGKEKKGRPGIVKALTHIKIETKKREGKRNNDALRVVVAFLLLLGRVEQIG